MLFPWTHGWGPSTFLWVWRTCAECLHDPGQETEEGSPGRGLLCSRCPPPTYSTTSPASAASASTPCPKEIMGPLRLRDRDTGPHSESLRATQTGQRFRGERPWKATLALEGFLKEDRCQDRCFQKGTWWSALAGHEARTWGHSS